MNLNNKNICPSASFRAEAVIFDMDGLMLDTERPFIHLWAQAGKTFGYNITKDTVLRMVGISNESARAVMTEEFGHDFPYEKLCDEIRTMLKKEYEKNGIPHKKGLIYLLDHLLNAKIPLAVATSTRRARALEMLEKAGICDRFKIIVAGDEVENGKPAPDIFLIAAEKLGIQPSSCIGFEDSTAGLKALHAAGIRSVFVKDIVQPPPEVLATVWRVFEDLEQAVNLFNF